MRTIIGFAVAMLIIGALIPKLYVNTKAPAPTATMAAATTSAPAAQSTGGYGSTITLQADRRGHFQVNGTVDGRHMDFLVDTGASVIALRDSDARRLGFHPSDRDYTAQVKTANGTLRAAPLTLERVDISGITVRNVQALVLPDTALGENLLGMSFLSRLRKVEMGNGRLVLEQ